MIYGWAFKNWIFLVLGSPIDLLLHQHNNSFAQLPFLHAFTNNSILLKCIFIKQISYKKDTHINPYLIPTMIKNLTFEPKFKTQLSDRNCQNWSLIKWIDLFSRNSLYQFSIRFSPLSEFTLIHILLNNRWRSRFYLQIWQLRARDK